MTIAILQLDVRAAISLLSGNASPSTVLQANPPSSCHYDAHSLSEEDDQVLYSSIVKTV